MHRYTPISDPDAKGYFDLLIKVLLTFCLSTLLSIFASLVSISPISYYNVCNKLFQVYPEGKMSQHFAILKPGDAVEVKG